jgi:excisionase family DNA binding protein
VRVRSALLTIEEVSILLGTSVRHVRRLVAERRIPIVKVGRFVRIEDHELEHWVDEHRIGEVADRSRVRHPDAGREGSRHAS